MHIVFTSDDNYLRYLGVTMCSVCENNADVELEFHVVLSGQVSDEGRDYLVGIASKYARKVNFYPIRNGLLDILPAGKAGQPAHISTAAYYRLFLASILPERVEKVIYLDCDLVVVGSLRPMWETDMSGCPIGAVTDMDAASLERYRRLRYPVRCGYFNSGVLLINLRYWRREGSQGLFEDFINAHLDRIVYHDQDVLNYVFRDNKKELPIKFNLQEGGLYTRVNLSWEYDDQLEEAIKNPVIVHYTTGRKPWNTGCTHPWRGLWYEYLDKAGVRDFKPVRKKAKKKTMKGRIRDLAVKLGLVEPLYEYRKNL